MAYVVVDTVDGRATVWGATEIIRSRKEASALADQLNKEENTNVYKAMQEMEWYRVYQPDTYQFVIDNEKRIAEEKAQRQAARAAKKVAEEKKLAAAKAYWADDRNFANVKPWWA